MGGDTDDNSSRNESWNSVMFMQQWKLSLGAIFQTKYIHTRLSTQMRFLSQFVCAWVLYAHLSLTFLGRQAVPVQAGNVLLHITNGRRKKKKSERAIYWNNIYFVSLNNIWTCCFNLSTSVWPPFSLLSLLMMSYYLSSKHKSLLWFLTLVIHVSSISRSHTYLSSHKLTWISYLSGSQKYSYSATGAWLLADIK